MSAQTWDLDSPEFEARLEAAVLGATLNALSEKLEADAERVRTYERMDADRTDLPGPWPTPAALEEDGS